MKTMAIGRISALMIPAGLVLILVGFFLAELVFRTLLVLFGLALLVTALRGFTRCANGCQKMIEEA